MKSRNRTILITAALILAAAMAAFLAFTAWDRSPAPAFNATIDRDCAPWDGPAFTVSIPYDPAATVSISIWQALDLLFPSAFSFPDETGRVGFAYVVGGDLLQPLAGRVTFARVLPGSPVQGEFDLKAQDGRYFHGRFSALWGNTAVMCG